MKINPNPIANNNNHLKKLEQNAIQLVKSLSEKPLLIDKIVVNKTQELLLKVNDNGLKFDIQLPISITGKLAVLSQNASISTTENLIDTTKLPSQPNLNNSPKLVQQPKILILQNEQNQIGIKIISSAVKQANSQALVFFSQASSSNNQQLKLAQPVNNAAVEGQSSKIVAQGQMASQPTSNSASIKTNLVVPQTSLASNKQSLESKIVLPTLQETNPKGNSSLVGRLVSQVSSKLNLLEQLKSKDVSPAPQLQIRTVSDAARELLAKPDIQQGKLAPNLDLLFKQVTSLGKSHSNLAKVETLLSQIKALKSVFINSTKPTALLVKERILTSGHQLEKNLLSSSPSSTLAKADGNQNHAVYQPRGDIKFQLLHIKQTLESIIKSAINERHESQKPVKQSPNTTSNVASDARSSTTIEQQNPILKSQSLEQMQKPPVEAMQKNVLQLQTLIKQSNETLTEVKHLISKIETNQLLSIRNEQPNIVQFLVDLPFGKNAEIDSFELLFERSDEHQENRIKKHWKVVVRFDLDPLGPMFAQVELENDKISTHIFAESQSTAKLINEHLHVFKKSLFSAGIDVGNIQGSQGNIPTELIKKDDRMVDIHA